MAKKSIKALVKEEKGEKEHKGGDFMEEELKEPYHKKGMSKKQIIKSEFGSEARAKKVEKMLKRK